MPDRIGTATSISKRWRTSRGSAIVELALSLPLLVTLLVGTADFGRVFYMSIQLTAAARAGAQFGAQSSSNSSDSASIRTAAATAAPNIGLAANSIDIPDAGQYPMCASDDTSGATFTPQASPATCSSSCSGSGHMVCYVKVTTTKNFTTISSFVPGVPHTMTISRTAYQVVN
jgi:Flp pilus assembly protein TadG